MRRLAPFVLLFASCANTSQAYKTCIEAASAKLIVPTVNTALVCDGDQACLEKEAANTAAALATEILSCEGK